LKIGKRNYWFVLFAALPKSMPKKDKVYIPSGIGGLIRYPEEEDAKIKLKPEHVIIISVLIIAVEIFLYFL